MSELSLSTTSFEGGDDGPPVISSGEFILVVHSGLEVSS